MYKKSCHILFSLYIHVLYLATLVGHYFAWVQETLFFADFDKSFAYATAMRYEI